MSLKYESPKIDFSRYTEVQLDKLFLLEHIYAQGLNLSDYTLLREIIYCESRWKKDAVGPTSDYGYFQIHAPSWETHLRDLGWDMYDPKDNLEAGVYIYKNYGPEQWVCYTNGIY